MTKLRQQMDDDMLARGRADRTRESYLEAVTGRARFYRRSPDRRRLGPAVASESAAGSPGHARRGRAPDVGAQASLRLEFRRPGARGPGQSGLSCLHPHRCRCGARREDDPEDRQGLGARGDRAAAPAGGGRCAACRGHARATISDRHHGRRNAGALSHRQHLAARRCACADAHRAAGCCGAGRALDTDSESSAQRRPPRDRDSLAVATRGGSPRAGAQLSPLDGHHPHGDARDGHDDPTTRPGVDAGRRSPRRGGGSACRRGCNTGVRWSRASCSKRVPGCSAAIPTCPTRC